MVFVVERYLPGLARTELLPALERLRMLSEQPGEHVSYLGSTIVLGDEACFCQFDGPSKEAVAEANRRANAPFQRVVAAVAVQPGS